MSVPKSERRQSDFEYVVILQKMEEFFLDNLEKEKLDMPRKLAEELADLAIKSYNNATLYFELCNGKVQGDIGHKKKYCKITMWTLRELAAQINIAMVYKMRHNKNTKGLQIKTQELLTAFNLLQKQLSELNRKEKDK